MNITVHIRKPERRHENNIEKQIRFRESAKVNLIERTICKFLYEDKTFVSDHICDQFPSNQLQLEENRVLRGHVLMDLRWNPQRTSGTKFSEMNPPSKSLHESFDLPSVRKEERVVKDFTTF